jgi:hypothetical protein
MHENGLGSVASFLSYFQLAVSLLAKRTEGMPLLSGLLEFFSKEQMRRKSAEE